MSSFLRFAGIVLLVIAISPAGWAQDRGVNLGDKLPTVDKGNAKLPPGVLPWYNRMRQNSSKGPVNPIAALQAQQQQAQSAVARQQAAIAAQKAAEKQKKKQQQNAVRAKQRAEEVAEREAGGK